MLLLILFLASVLGNIQENSFSKCDIGNLTYAFDVQTGQNANYHHFWDGTLLNIRCKSTGRLSWTYCQKGTWIVDDKLCIKKIEDVEAIALRPNVRKKRFIIFLLWCLFTSCARPRPRDRVPPEIRNCPNDIYNEAIPYQLYVFVEWIEPDAFDNKDGKINIRLNGKKPGSPFFEGKTTVGYYAKDSSGNMATCNFNVYIKVVRCPPLSTKIADGYRWCHPSSDMVKGTLCSYGCYQGHVLNGGPDRIECLKTGEWSSRKEPYCEKKTCADMITVGHLSLSCTDNFYFRSICSYSCDDGYDIPRSIRRSKVCLASGHWNGDNVKCVDVQPPTFDNCPRTLLFFPGDNANSSYIHWTIPTVSDNEDVSVTPRQLSGPFSSTRQPVNSYTIKYEATDSAGNKAKECSFNVVVKQLRCRRLFPLPYMQLNCTGTRRGSECSFSCDSNAALNGTHKTFCIRQDNMPFSKWNMPTQPFCQVANTCKDLAAPRHGALACDVWLGGKLCHPLCSEGYSVLSTNPLPGILLCLDDGTWLYEDKITDCIRRISSLRRLAVMSAEFYYSGDCHDPDVQLEIKETFLEVITQSASWQSKCQSPACNIQNVKVLCGKKNRKRSASNLKVEMKIYFQSNSTQLTSVQYDEETSYLAEIMQYIESNIREINITDHKNGGLMAFSSISSGGLDVECPTNSVSGFGSNIGCIACPAGTFYHTSSSSCVKCQRGSYQPDEAQDKCVSCKNIQTTANIGARSVNECEDACTPGTWSYNGLPPCVECDIGSYENSYGSVECKRCPGNRITIREGSINLSDCYDFDIVFPNNNMESSTEVNLDDFPGLPIYLSFHTIIDSNSTGSMVQISEIMHIEETVVTMHGDSKELPDKLLRSQKWKHIAVEIGNGSTVVYIDGQEEINFNSTFKTLPGTLKVTLGGYGFSGTISQFNIMHGSGIDRSNMHAYSICDSENHTFGELNWSDFAYSSLINCYIDIPSRCDDVDNCKENPCLNGTCNDLLDGYNCFCSNGFTGKNCEINIDDCEYHACLNNASCIDGIDSYVCQCDESYTGELCEISMVNGQWSEWDTWTECSTSCGNGTIKRRRSCSNPLPDNGGKYCNGDDTEIKVCNQEACRECSMLVATNHSSLLCSNDSDMIICNHTCNEGYLFDHDVKQHYRCGNDTFYYWDFQTEDNPYERLPSCTEVITSPLIYVDYSASYDVDGCDVNDFMTFKNYIQNKLKSTFRMLQCSLDGTCSVGDIDITTCGKKTRQRRDLTNDNVGYSVTLACNATLFGTEDCYLQLADSVAQIKEFETDGIFDVKYNSKTFGLLPNSSISESRLSCDVGTVPYIAYCVPCSVGHYYANETCIPCPLGMYQHLTGHISCFECPKGTTTKGTSSISVEDCNVYVLKNEIQKQNFAIIAGITVMIVAIIIIVLILLTTHIRQKLQRKNNKTHSQQTDRHMSLCNSRCQKEGRITRVWEIRSYSNDEYEQNSCGKIQY